MKKLTVDDFVKVPGLNICDGCYFENFNQCFNDPIVRELGSCVGSIFKLKSDVGKPDDSVEPTYTAEQMKRVAIAYLYSPTQVWENFIESPEYKQALKGGES